MLVLSRKKGEQVIIPDLEIVVEVIEVRGDKVRLGFTAAKDISIHRMEVFDAIERNKKLLAASVVASQV